ncbi:unnamed protein product [Adineta steineri]|uniref:Uncharacterized protein n=1 Tax=Adineta steineri TaxID=433720 RepID=A0A813P0U8_9BILA|nr:unnamed protein product [Adineta steineri]CAF0861288.1 unnamed protein product [Adineta steineri]
MNNHNGKNSMITTVATVSAASAVIQRNVQIMRITLALTVLSFITFSIALTSSYWVVITYPPEFLAVRQNLFIVRTTYGIIWECALSRPTKTSMYENRCDYHPNQVHNTSSLADQTLVGMVRTMMSFSAIHILLLIITFICGLYSIREYRYTYKRLTGMIYILTAASLLVCIEVLSTIFRHASEHLPEIYPKGTKHSFGICYILAWLIFILLLTSSLAFFVCSKKRKGAFDEATEEEALANVPVTLGRI